MPEIEGQYPAKAADRPVWVIQRNAPEQVRKVRVGDIESDGENLSYAGEPLDSAHYDEATAMARAEEILNGRS